MATKASVRAAFLGRGTLFLRQLDRLLALAGWDRYGEGLLWHHAGSLLSVAPADGRHVWLWRAGVRQRLVGAAHLDDDERAAADVARQLAEAAESCVMQVPADAP